MVGIKTGWDIIDGEKVNNELHRLVNHELLKY